MLVGLLPSICKSYGFDANTLYSSIMDRIGTKLYATLEDVKNDLDRLVERARLLNRLREEHKKLRGILDEARKEYERVKDQLSRDRRQAFEGYLKSLEEFDESYSRELPSDVASVVGHMFEYSWSPRCPSDITHELYKKISGSIDGLVKLLEDIKSIAERLSYGQDLVDRVERLLGELKSGNEGQTLTKYHEYLTSSDSILGDLIHNIQAEYEREGVIEVDLTEQTAEVISALVRVFRGYGMRVTLRCVRA
jgi:vacuolar-type H+-ATPase subunit E/Vma4